MKPFIFTTVVIIGLIFTSMGQAQVLVRSFDSNYLEFEKYLLTKPATLSYVDQFRRRSSSKKTIELDGRKETLIKEIELMETAPLHESELEILISLYLKLKDTGSNEDQELASSRVFGILHLHPALQQSFFEEWGRLSNRKTRALSKAEVFQLVDQKRKDLNLPDLTLFVDGLEYNQLQQRTVVNETHQWVFISNATKPLVLRGTLKEIKEKNMILEYFTKSTCGQFHQQPLLEELDAQVFFSETCIQSPSFGQEAISQPTKEVKSTSSWLVPAGIVVGALVLYEMRDKKLVIKLPF
ncbi:MAG: hypothetical protein BroJett040_22650 [Oligoflexia bacterium]|nr:MAG: hypothetical protein BroJett040_22650 [Oligoflexia bacterium]